MVVIGILFGFVLGTFMTAFLCNDILKNNNTALHKNYFKFLCKWLKRKQDDENLLKWFEERGYSGVCLYGLGEIGKRFVDETSDSNITIVCAIDKVKKREGYQFPVYSLKEVDRIENDFDVIVVSAFFYFDGINDELKKHFDCEIVSIDEVI